MHLQKQYLQGLHRVLELSLREMGVGGILHADKAADR